MAKQGMKRYKPGNGMTKQKQNGQSGASPVTELQGKAKQSKGKASPAAPIHE